jgi:hypothetical protein
MTVDEFQLEFIRQIRMMYTDEDMQKPVDPEDILGMLSTLTILSKALFEEEPDGGKGTD